MMKQSLTFDDVLLVPQYSEIESRKDVSLKVINKNNRFSLDLPVFSSNMDTITESDMANYMNSKGAAGVLHRFMSIEKNLEEFQKSQNAFVSIGTSESEYDRLIVLAENGAKHFCVDVAHGHHKSVAHTIKLIKTKVNDAVVMAGNVATYDGAKFLADSGADLVKVGIGPGSVCSTRIKTGFGVPQLSAIQNCSQVNVSIVADGGIKTPGDIVKALAFGADYVMIGSMLSGTHYTPGLVGIDQFSYVKRYRGMASREVNEEYFGVLSDWKTAEGVSLNVPYKNEMLTEQIMQDIIGGLRSGLTYCGAKDVTELRQKAQYVVVTNNGLLESHPHKK